MIGKARRVGRSGSQKPAFNREIRFGLRVLQAQRCHSFDRLLKSAIRGIVPHRFSGLYLCRSFL